VVDGYGVRAGFDRVAQGRESDRQHPDAGCGHDPPDRTLPAPDGKNSLRVFIQTLDTDKAVVELEYGPSKDGHVKAKTVESFQLEPWVAVDHDLAIKKDKWVVTATLGHVWDAPKPVATDDTNKYVLAWDDAPMTADPPPKAPDPAAPPPKPSKKAPPPPPPFVKRPLPDGRKDALSQASPIKVVDVYESSHLQAESVPAPGPAHCQAGGPSTDAAPTVRYVSLKDLVPKVPAHGVVGKLPDGTGYTVAAGVPVIPEGDDWRVQTGGLSFLIKATPEDLAFYYRPSEHFTANPPPSQIQLPPGTVGQTALGPVTWSGSAPLPVVGMGLSGTATPIATIQVPCAEVRLAPDPAVLKK